MEYCQGCPGYGVDADGKCKFCGKQRKVSAPSYSPLGHVNPFELGRLLAEKRERERRSGIPQLSDCPNCTQHALAYDPVNDSFTCQACKYSVMSGTVEYNALLLAIVDQEKPVKREPSPKKPDKNNLFANVIWPDNLPNNSLFVNSKPIQDPKESTIAGLSNPMLLSVKMFLADVRSWRRQYRAGEYVCSDFAREVFDTATKRNIRCGYVIIKFVNNDVGHAVVAFKTDYGLKFFEPQSGNEEDVIIGRRYSVQIEGMSEDNIISGIKITWNDGTTSAID
jgi:hypothetical protein